MQQRESLSTRQALPPLDLSAVTIGRGGGDLRLRQAIFPEGGGLLRAVGNLDFASPSQLELCEASITGDLSEHGLGARYRGRNCFDTVAISEAEAFAAERALDARSIEALPSIAPRLSEEAILLCGSGNSQLTTRIAKLLGVSPGTIVLDRFPNSETRIEVHESVRDCEVFVVMPMTDPVNEAVMETALLVQALKLADARKITVVLPYFAYSRQDRKADTRPPISAKVIADILKSQGAHQVVTIDLHATQVEGFFDGPFENLSGLLQLLPPLVKNEGGDLVVVSPDAGGSKRAEQVARGVERLTGVFAPLLIMSKFRKGPSVPPTVTLSGGDDVIEGKVCVLVDDMIDTGGSILAAARVLKERGAKRVVVCATHGIFSHDAVAKLRAAEIERNGASERVVDQLYVTDTVAMRESRGDFVRVVSIAPLIAEAIARLHTPQGSLRNLKERMDLGTLLPVRSDDDLSMSSN